MTSDEHSSEQSPEQAADREVHDEPRSAAGPGVVSGPLVDRTEATDVLDNPAKLLAIRRAERDAARNSYDIVAGEASYASDLADAASRFLAEPDDRLEAGSLVQWKPGLKQFDFPDYGRPMSFLGRRVERAGTPLIASISDEVSDAYIGFIDGERLFEVRSVDSRRLRIWVDAT